MHKNEHTLVYHIPEVPDSSSWQSQIVAGGDVYSAIFTGSEHLLRQFSHMAPESASAEHLFVFDPICKNDDKQSRLHPYLCIQASDADQANAVDMLIQRGELSQFYKFESTDKVPNWPKSLSACCSIVRCQDFIEPLHSCDLNAKIPDCYCVTTPFVPNEKNDFQMLNRVLDKVQEPVVISVRVQPTDISHERHAVTTLMHRYHSINHSRNYSDQDDAGIGYLTGDDDPYRTRRYKLSPLDVEDPTADDAYRCLRPIHESLCHQPHLFFSICIASMTEATARLVGGVFAEAAFAEGKYRLVGSKTGQAMFEKTAQFDRRSQLAPVPVYKSLSCEKGGHEYSELRRLTQLATVDELKGAFRFPVASAFSPTLCLRKSTDPPYEDPNDLIVMGYDEQGIEGNSNPIPRGSTLEELRKHAAIFAVSGFGKTTLLINILYQLYAKNIPFIVIETSKTELRAIKKFRKHKNPYYRKLGEALQVFTLGKEKCSPLRFNPLEIPKGIERDAHIVKQMECFLALMPIFPALPGILSEAMELTYDNNPSSSPIIADLYASCLKVLSEKSYRGEVRSNIEGALDVRLGGLTRLIAGNVFKCRTSIPSIPHLMSSYSIVEMDQLSQDEKCVQTLSLFNSVLEHVQCLPPADGLRLVIVLEESHNVLRQSGEARPSEESPDPKAYVVDLINRLLVELRARGAGIILADQHPSDLDPSAIKSTCTKVAGAEIHGDDREALAVSMLLPDFQAEDLARMKAGEDYFFKEGYYRPVRLKTKNLHEELDLTKFPTDDELLDNIRQDKWFQKMAVMRASTELDQLKAYMDAYDDQRMAIAKKVKGLLEVYHVLLDQVESQLRKQRLVIMIRRLTVLKNELILSYKQFMKGPYRLFSYLIEGELDATQANLSALAVSLNKRYESEIQSGTRGLLSVIDRLMKNCLRLKLKEMNDAKKR